MGGALSGPRHRLSPRGNRARRTSADRGTAMRSITALTIVATLTLAACGDRGVSLNPFRWFGGGAARGPETLTPEGGYDLAARDPRQLMSSITSARWEPLGEGRLLVVTGLAPTKGWWDPELVTKTPMPAGRIRADADGVLRLRFVAFPPPPDSPDARRPANPQVDTITTAMTISTPALRGIDQVVIQGAGNVITLRR